MKKILLNHVEQKWDAFCGPATLAMLLSQHGIFVHQKKIAQAAHMKDGQIKELGMRMDQLALSVRRVSPSYALWAKRKASIEDLNTIINVYGLACGVEWQEITSEEELIDLKEEGLDPDKLDMGHYSVITGIDLENKKLALQNPSYYAHKKEQTLTIDDFEKRWFDTNQLEKDAPEEAKEWTDDDHLLFFVAPKTMIFPESLGVKKIRIAPTFKKETPWKKLGEFVQSLQKKSQHASGHITAPTSVTKPSSEEKIAQPTASV